MKNTLFFLCLHISINCFAQQNLIPNSSFEEYTNCPVDSDNQRTMIDSLSNWFMPTIGSTDYFNTCLNKFNSFWLYSFGVPVNMTGFQLPNNGQAYIGFVLYIPPTLSSRKSYREYISVKLKKSLKTNKVYHYCPIKVIKELFNHYKG